MIALAVGTMVTLGLTLSTLKALLAPFSAPPLLVAVIVRAVPATETVTVPLQSPPMKLPEIAGLMEEPPETLKSAVPAKPPTVLLRASCAVIVMLKGVSAVWEPPSVASAKWAKVPAVTVRRLESLLVKVPEAARMVAVPT